MAKSSETKAPQPRHPLRREVPAPLACATAARVAARLALVKRQALEDIAEIKSKTRMSAELFFDIGIVLRRLAQPGVAASVGYASFDVLCREQLGFSAHKANELILIASRASRSQALQLGQNRTAALIALADAMPAVELQSLLDGHPTVLPGDRVIDPLHDAVAKIEELAKEARSPRSSRTGRPIGRTTTPTERLVAARLQAGAHARGLLQAKVVAVATRPGQPSNVRIEGVPLAQVAVLGEVLAGRTHARAPGARRGRARLRMTRSMRTHDSKHARA